MKRYTPLMLALLLLGLPGCKSVQQSFPGHDPDSVWTALVAVAESPNYDDMEANQMWEVRDNGIWADVEGNRIEIYRRLHRTFHQAAGRYHEETRQYLIVVNFDPGPAPTATFKVKKGALPAWSRNAGMRYFDDVLELLGEAGPTDVKPLTVPAIEVPAPNQESSTTQPDEESPDLEEVLDPGDDSPTVTPLNEDFRSGV
ncbi:MAG: hypothetical protein O7G85_14025 [Planctomycetota bacterium]|nr:hypothetical protein [Planctomycetota bacterium]